MTLGMGREGIHSPVRWVPLSSTSLITTVTSTATQRAADKGECCIASLIVLLGALLCTSLVFAVKEVDTKEGEEEEKEKRRLLKL